MTPRLCKIRLKGPFANFSVINAHAPTEDKDDIDKDQFYEDLNYLLASCPKNDIEIILSDMNAKIGRKSGFKPTIRMFSLHEESNDNGTSVIHLAAEHNMVIASTMIDHKNIHKKTLKSPDRKTFNQIDHVLIDARHLSNILGVKSRRGANFDTDHYLVTAKIRCRISNARKVRGERSVKFDKEIQQ